MFLETVILLQSSTGTMIRKDIRICLNAEWKNQLVVPNDIAEAVFYTKDVYDRIVEKQGNEISKLIVEGQAQRFEENPEASSYVWDSLQQQYGSIRKLQQISRKDT